MLFRSRSDGDTGATVARRMLDANGCNAVGIKGVAGELTDHYNPQDNNLYLSDANRSGGSVASVAVACHEAGHAAQRQSGYAMMKVRTALVPVVNFTQNTWTIVLLMGLFMNIALMNCGFSANAASVFLRKICWPPLNLRKRSMGRLI